MLSPPRATGAMSLEQALATRRSNRAFASRPVSTGDVGQLCWAAQGITGGASGQRTAPSAGALYPLEIYVVLTRGVFRYEPGGHRLTLVRDGDRRDELARAALDQDVVRQAGVDMVITAVTERTRAKYGARAERYATLEAGHAAQNVLLQAAALGLAAVPVGAFDDAAVRGVVGASAEELPLYVVPIGAKAP